MAYPNVFESLFEYDESDPGGYRTGVCRVGEVAGGIENVVKLFEVPPGESLCPYHYEYVEEWMLVIDGPVELRGPDGWETIVRGSLVCFPRGPRGAHKVSNAGQSSAHVLMWSSSQEPAVSVYPDSGKIGVWPGNPDDTVMLQRADGNVDYFDGEP